MGGVKVSGFSGASSVPVGAVLKESYWALPGPYMANTAGRKLTYVEALEKAIKDKKKAVADHERSHRELYPGMDVVPLPPWITLDHRWVLEYHGGRLDTVIERRTFESLEAAERLLEVARLTK